MAGRIILAARSDGTSGVVATSTTEVGYTDTTGAVTIGQTNRLLSSAMFTAPYTGTIISISAWGYCTSSTADVEVGLYRDSGGVPSVLIGSASFSDIGIYGSSGSEEWKSFSPVSFAVVSGQTYYLSWNANSSGFKVGYRNIGGTNRWYQSLSFGTSWPDPYAPTSSSQAKYLLKATLEY